MSSAGAEQASLLGRGERALDLPADYRFILPTLPANDSSKCTAFLHAEIGVRPYRIEDFKEPLRQLGVLSDVTGMGVFQMGHVWIVRLKSTAAKEKLMMSGKFKVKGGWCVPMDPDRREVRLKLHWVPFDVPNDALKRALEEFGVVREITREKWHIDGFDGVKSSTRVARLSLKEGRTLENLPHQLRITRGPVLAVVPGRAPNCLRYKRSGHIRRDCRAPRCSECHEYGHERQDCVRSHARVAGGRQPDENTNELVMDEQEAEQAAAPSTQASVASATSKVIASKECEGKPDGEKEPFVVTAPAETRTAKLQDTTGDFEHSAGSDAATVEAAAEKTATFKEKEVVPENSPSEKTPLDAIISKRRLEDLGASSAAASEQALRRLEYQWKVAGKKGRYTTRSRSPSRAREDRLSQ
uniref:CCHC-type domain-containing protein n=1 Tax=Ixodes ricinus TaxID=34613 RepID=A0A6B0VAX7_IXORI